MTVSGYAHITGGADKGNTTVRIIDHLRNGLENFKNLLKNSNIFISMCLLSIFSIN